ncbi:MAG: RHS repeat-associated core domain-containing protein, partial [Gemmatimonadota bacterium]
REWARSTTYAEPRRDEVMGTKSNRITSSTRHDNLGVLITDTYLYNADGSRRQDDECHPGCAAIQLFQYDSLGRAALMADLGGALGTCSYDPLGRIAVSCDATASGKRMGLTYDGNSVVRASQPIDNQAVAGYSFVHGPGTDDPLLGYQAWTTGHLHVYYITDGQGRQFAVATKAGVKADTIATFSNDGGRYSGGATSAYTFGVARPISSGSATGVSYFRNRMYDQATGRFTQEDPSGIAGGVNLYQYSGNSPANFSDPFGLCPDKLLDENGKCPGGLTIGEWRKVLESLAHMSMEAMTRTSTLLGEGQITSRNAASNEYGSVTGYAPGTVRINRTSVSGSVFDDPVILPKTLIHEGRHTQQLEGKAAGKEAVEYVEHNKQALEDDAYAYEAANYVP